MKFYEIVYYNKEGYRTHEQTDSYVIWEIDEDKTKSRFYRSYNRGKEIKINGDIDWTIYIHTGFEKPLSEQELFAALL